MCLQMKPYKKSKQLLLNQNSQQNDAKETGVHKSECSD